MNKIQIPENRIEQLIKEYEETHCIFLPDFVEKYVLQNMLTKLSKTQFQNKVEKEGDDEFGKVLALSSKDPGVFTFHLLMNDPNLFLLLERITKCNKIGNFMGRIHRSVGDEKHEIDWHGDNSDTRLLAITLNLGTELYSGARFQIRKKGTQTVLREFGQTNAGDAFIFRIRPDLEHRLSPVEDGIRTVGVGWFRAQPDFATFAKAYLKPF